MAFQHTRLCAFACAAALALRGSSAVNVASCADLAPFTTGDALTEDVSMFLEDSRFFTCEEVTTVYAKGPYSFRVTSDNADVEFTGIRFEITDGAEFSLYLKAAEESVSTATFTGVTGQESDGGVFSVDSTSSATFGNVMVFQDNSVVSPYHGGAVFAGGMVDFEYMAMFNGNAVLTGPDYNTGGGGGLAVGANSGSVMFHDFAYFTGNEVRNGGRGGGMENLGEAYFSRASYFMANYVSEDGDEVGGEGGAIYTGEGSTTTFKRRTIHQSNSAGNGGGALWNEGTTTLMSNGFLKGNSALGVDAADGGHIWTSGEVTVDGFVNLRDGKASRDGGAVYIAAGGSLDVAGVVTLERNSAGDSCADVFPCTA